MKYQEKLNFYQKHKHLEVVLKRVILTTGDEKYPQDISIEFLTR